MMAFKRFIYLILFTSLIFLNSCGTNRTNKIIKIPPNQAQIIGQIISVEPVSNSNGSNDICSKYPCIAVVKISSLNYGAGFPPLSIGSQIRIRFAFTLSRTTSEMFPNMKKSYPGLKKGDTFTGLISYIKTIDNTVPSFQIFNYSIK